MGAVPLRWIREHRFRVICLAALIAWGCRPQMVTVAILHPESLSPLISELSSRFEGNHPSIRISAQTAFDFETYQDLPPGSYDLVAVADQRLLRGLPGLSRHLEESHPLTGDEIVLASFPQGPLADTVNRQRWQADWINLLFQENWQYPLPDPHRGPDGYWVHLAWKLTEVHYGRNGLYSRLTANAKSYSGSLRSITEELRRHRFDLAFLYRSTALQNGLDFITLPPQVALGDRAYASFFAHVYLPVDGVDQETLEISGAPIEYAIGLSNDSSPQARLFLHFLLSEEAQSLFREMGYSH